MRTCLQEEKNFNSEAGGSPGCWLFSLHQNTEMVRKKDGTEILSNSAFKPFLVKLVSTACSSWRMNDTDASIPFGNAQLNCRGSSRHMVGTPYVTETRLALPFQSMSTARRQTGKEWGRFLFVCLFFLSAFKPKIGNSFYFLETIKFSLHSYTWKLKRHYWVVIFGHWNCDRSNKHSQSLLLQQNQLCLQEVCRAISSWWAASSIISIVVTNENKNYLTKFDTSFPIATSLKMQTIWGNRKKKKCFKHPRYYFIAQQAFSDI